jgi:hypothetical protein
VIRWIGLGVMLAASCWWQAATAVSLAQVVTREREATVTGPRGRTIDRRLEVERGPGTYSRQLQIQRPGGTFDRSLSIQRGWAGGFSGGGFGSRPGPIFERNVFFAPRPASSWSFGFMAAPLITFPFWQPAPPPPVVVAPGPAVIATQPGGVPPVAPQSGGAQPSPLDPVALAAGRLQSHHSSSRRDAAQTLGRLGDPRAIPPLVHALKYDSSKDVKIAAATALGEIGGPDSKVVLERCIIYEKKQEVRDAAAAALRNLRERRDSAPARGSSGSSPLGRTAPADDAGPGSSEVPRLSPWVPSRSSQPSPLRSRVPREEPALDRPADVEAQPSGDERVPPPLPTPVNPS